MTNQTRAGLRPRDIVLTALTIALLLGVYFGGTAGWQKYRGPSQATAADCRTGQHVIDGAQNLPRGADAQKKSYTANRALWSTISDGYLQATISEYTGGAYAAAKGQPVEMTHQSWDEMVSAANSHCDVQLTMPAYPVTWSK